MTERYRKALSVRYRKLNGEHIVVVRGQAFRLDEVAFLIWDHCDGNRTVADLVELILAEYDQDRSQVETDCREFLAQGVTMGVLTPA